MLQEPRRVPPSADGGRGSNRVFRRRVRRKTHFPGRKCASESECAQRPASPRKNACIFEKRVEVFRHAETAGRSLGIARRFHSAAFCTADFLFNILRQIGLKGQNIGQLHQHLRKSTGGIIAHPGRAQRRGLRFIGHRQRDDRP